MNSSPVHSLRGAPACLWLPLLSASVVAIGCYGDAGGDGAATGDFEAKPSLAEQLAGGEVVFGVFSNPREPGHGVRMGNNREIDFVFYSLESGPFDIDGMVDYMTDVESGSAPGSRHAFALRVPPVRDGPIQARANVSQALAAGVDAVVFPHVETAGQAALAVSLMSQSASQGQAGGRHVNMLIVEDREGIEQVEEIVATPGVNAVFAGPGDLRRAYDGDITAVEDAIQAVLAACKAHDVPCGITANADDIGERIAQGFHVFIVSDPLAVTAGRKALER